MSDKTQRIKGKANEVAGKTKTAVGHKTGSSKTEGKGAAQTIKGEGQQVAGHLRGAAKAATD